MAKKTIKDYFKTLDTFTKDLPATIQCSSVQAVREELKVVQEHANGKYQKVSPKDKARIAQYADRNGISAALHHLKSARSFPSLKENTVCEWKNAYCTELLSGSRRET